MHTRLSVNLNKVALLRNQRDVGYPSVEEMARCVRTVQESDRRVLTEASGGVTIENIRAVAEAGVDIVSSGSITHSAKALDISLEVETVPA